MDPHSVTILNLVNYCLITVIVMGRYCLPDATALLNSTISAFYSRFEKYFDVNKITAYVSDMAEAWYILLIAVGVAFILSFIYMLLLRCCASIMVFISLVGILLALGGFGFWLYVSKDNFITTSNNYKFCLYGAYALWGLDGLYLFLLLCLCNRIRLGVAIIKCTA